MLRRRRATSSQTSTHPFLAFSGTPGVVLRDVMTDERITNLIAPMSDISAAPWLNCPANNHGFISRHDYPWFPNPAEFGDQAPFVVAVLGGSAAHWMSLMAEDILTTSVEEGWPDNSRSIQVLNAASGGFKQPQTLLTLTMLLSLDQPIDAVIVLDGFNDVALSHLNWTQGFDALAPSAAHLRMIGVKVASDTRQALGRAATMDLIVEHWDRCTRLVHDLCRSREIPISHLIQPNQYCSEKTLTPQEHNLALSDTSPYRLGVELGYPLLREKVVTLAADGYTVVDAADLFDQVTEATYADNCCHYNTLGNEIVGRAAAEVLSGVLKGGKHPTSSKPQAIQKTQPSPPAVTESIDRPTHRPRKAAGAPPDDVYPFW